MPQKKEKTIPRYDTSPRYDWLDEQFGDEIDLLRAAQDAPPTRLVSACVTRGILDKSALDAAWYFLGKIKTSQRRAQSEATFACRRCGKSRRRSRVKSERFELPTEPAHEVSWLRGAPQVGTSTTKRGGAYRVGRCPSCEAIFWFELILPVKEIK